METPASFILASKSSHFEFNPLNFSNGLLKSNLLRKVVSLVSIRLIAVVKTSAKGPILAFTSLILSLRVLKNCTSGPFCTIIGDTNSAPILASEAFTFDIAPLKVSLALFALSPKAEFIADEKISKEICPFETISLTSDSVLFKYLAISAAAFIPRDESCNKS